MEKIIIYMRSLGAFRAIKSKWVRVLEHASRR
jgi:hypothetical protein